MSIYTNIIHKYIIDLCAIFQGFQISIMCCEHHKGTFRDDKLVLITILFSYLLITEFVNGTIFSTSSHHMKLPMAKGTIKTRYIYIYIYIYVTASFHYVQLFVEILIVSILLFSWIQSEYGVMVCTNNLLLITHFSRVT